MRTDFVAYHSDNTPTIGRQDHGELSVKDYRRSRIYRMFKAGTIGDMAWVAYWKVVQDGKTVEIIPNKHYIPVDR